MEGFQRPKAQPASKPEEMEKLPEHVVVMERPEARYRILYEDHRHFGDHTVEAVRGADAVAFEGVTVFSPEVRLGIPLDPGVASHIREKQIPLYLFDIESDGDYAKLFKLRTQFQAIEMAAGELAQAYVGVKAAQAIVKHDVNRRDFLKMSAAAVVGAKGYLAQDVLSEKNRQLSAQERSLVELREKVSPELDVINFTLRNALWAYKLKAVIVPKESERIGGKPEVASIVGYNHTGLENMLQKEPKELLEIISNVMNLLKKASNLLGLDKPRIAISGVASYQLDKDANNRWAITDYESDPRLREIGEAYAS